jgi:ankyrin repeat protein
MVIRLLRQAAKSGYVKGMRLLVADLAARVDVPDAELPLIGVDLTLIDAQLLLCIAALHGQLDMIRCLVELGAYLQHPSFCEVTPLIFAVRNGHLDVVRYLVKECKVDVNQACIDLPGAPRIWASSHAKLEAGQWLRRLNPPHVRFNGFTPLHFVAMSDQLDMMRFLLTELCADIGKAIVNGNTPLHVAASCNSCNVARCLVEEFGVDVNEANVDGVTPLNVASFAGHLEMARCLVMELGADIYKATPDGNTPFLAAIMQGDLDMMRLLATELGVDVNQGGLGQPRGQPLFSAAFRCQIDVMRCLVEELGASITEVDVNGDTVLLYSLRNGKLASAQYLLEHGGSTLTEKNTKLQPWRRDPHCVDMAWDLLAMHMGRIQIGDFIPARPTKDPEAMTALLRVMVLRGAPPPMPVDDRLPVDRLVVDKGARLRVQLPAYLTRRRALVDTYCLLIPPLLALVHGYEPDMPATTDEIWSMELSDMPSISIRNTHRSERPPGPPPRPIYITTLTPAPS